MDPYKSIFKTLLCTDNYMTKTALSNYIKSYIDSTKENSVDQILHRRFNIFVKEGLLEKYHNGTEVIYKRSELARNIHKKFGTELLMKAYDIIQLSKNKDAQTIIRNLAEIMNTDSNESPTRFYSPYLSQNYYHIFLSECELLYKFIHSYQKIFNP